MESRLVNLQTEDDAPAGRRRYSLRELAELAHVSPRRVNGWVRAGLIRPAESGAGGDRFGFRNVRTARLLAKLARNGIGPAQLKRIFEQLQQRFPDANEAVSQLDLMAGLLVIRGDDSRLTAPNGQLLLDLLGEGDSAATVALRLQPGDRPAVADEAFERAVALEQSGDLEAAAQAYRESLLETGPEPAACFNLANVLADLGQTEAAAERYRQVVELDPEYAAAWNNLGLSLADIGDRDGAIEAWRRAVKLDERSADALFNLADALYEAGHATEARPHWEAYLRLDEDTEWSAYARYCLGR
jgi:tetratricopeptide (TPR) repeat protein